MKRISLFFALLALIIASLGTVSAQDENPLLGTWHWLDFQGGDDSLVSSDNPANYTLTFNEDMTVAVKADCNNAMGEYTLDGSQVSIVLGPMTMVACDDSSLSNQFVDYLGQVVSFVIGEDGRLHLALMMDAGIMSFIKAPLTDPMPPVQNPLENTWYWAEFNSETSNDIIATPSLYSVTLTADGNAYVTADCKVTEGTYTVENTLLRFELGPTTMQICSEESLADQFISYLTQSDSFALNRDGSMTLILELGAGTMNMHTSAHLIQGAWQWSSSTSMNDEQLTVPQPVDYLATFNADGIVDVKADCNHATGEYTINGNQIDIQMGRMTRAMCPEESLSNNFVQMLDGAVSAVFENGNLYLAQPMDGDIMELTPALIGTTWLWQQTITPVEKIDVDQPQNYKVTFNEDGTANVKADCNNAMGDYTIDGTSMSVEMGPMTLAMCPEGSLSDNFVQQLSASAIYFFDNGYLYIDLFADGGTMRFVDESKIFVGSVVGTWELTDYRQANVTSAVADPSLYVVTFTEDALVSVTSDCKSAEGGFTQGNGIINIELGPTTMEICPGENSLGDMFLSWLNVAESFSFEYGNLKLELDAESDGTLWLRPAGE